MKVPSCYASGYEAARPRDPLLAETYIRHTTIGDPLADKVVDDLAAHVGPEQVHRVIGSALESHDRLPGDAPASLRDLIGSVSVMPEWFDRDLAMAGTRAFFRDAESVLSALAMASLVEGFSTLISKSFRIRSRITTNGVRRLKQNMLQLVEQFMPGGLEPGGDGWKLSLRIRLVHAQSRKLIREGGGEWDSEAHGMPLSAAHMLLGAAAFSGRLMHHVDRIGGGFNTREREAYVHVWRWTGQIMGIPDAIMFHDEASARWTFEIGALCEPPPDEDAIIMANSIINSTPLVLGYRNPAERRAQARIFFQGSRELIGDDLANRFKFPAAWALPLLPWLRLKQRAFRMASRVPMLRPCVRRRTFRTVLDVSNLNRLDHSYSLPTSLYDDESLEW